jgi:hypothetical protein
MPWKVYIIMMGLHPRRGRKGQIVFEFVIATLFFLAIVMYTITYMNNSVFMHSSEHRLDTLESRAWQISEGLVTGKGVWSGGVPQEIGLALDWPVLNETSISELDTWCGGNWDDFMGLLDVEPNLNNLALSIDKFTDPGETNLLECGSPPQGIPGAGVTRFAVGEDGSVLKVGVWYW